MIEALNNAADQSSDTGFDYSVFLLEGGASLILSPILESVCIWRTRKKQPDRLPDKNTHLQQARRNKNLASTLSSTTFLDWAVTIYLYAALHHVEAFFSLQGINSANHEERNRLVNAQLKPIRTAYHALRLTSRQTRYGGLVPSNQELTDAQRDYQDIKTYVSKLLGIET